MAQQTLIEKQRFAFELATVDRFPWPYKTEYRPPDSEDINVFGVVDIPAYGAANQVVIAEWQVALGYTFILREIAFWTNGGSYIDGQDLVFTVDVNTQSVTNPLVNGYPFQGFDAVPFTLGDAQHLYPLRQECQAQQVVRIKGYSVANVGTGAPNYLFAIIKGYQFGEVEK